MNKSTQQLNRKVEVEKIQISFNKWLKKNITKSDLEDWGWMCIFMNFLYSNNLYEKAIKLNILQFK